MFNLRGSFYLLYMHYTLAKFKEFDLVLLSALQSAIE